MYNKMKIYKSRYTSAVLFTVLFVFLVQFSGQCFAVGYQYLKVHNGTTDYDIKVDQLEEYWMKNNYEGEFKKFDLKELSRIGPGQIGETYTTQWWLGMVVFGKNFDHRDHKATLHVMKKGSDTNLGSKDFYLKNGKGGQTPFTADGKNFIITVRPENWRFYEGKEGAKTGITYPDYHVTVTEK